MADPCGSVDLDSNANLEHSVALTVPHTNRTLNTRANPGGPIAHTQTKGLASVETWVDTLAGGGNEDAGDAMNDE